MMHVIPNENKPDYVISLINSIRSLSSVDDFEKLSDHDLDIVITALELAYECTKGVLHIRESRQTW